MSISMRKDPHGQVLVIFAGGLVAILVIAALVIDIGFTLALRRAEQNAVDPGAVAAARYIQASGGTYGDMVKAACFYAQQNAFFVNAPGYPTNTGCVPANDANGSTLTVNWPPGSDAGTFAGDRGKVQVGISRQHQSFLARIVGITQIKVSSSAVAAFDGGNSNSSSLIALDPGCSGSSAGFITGGGIVKIYPAAPGITGGYVHVNSSCGSSSAIADDTCNNDGSGALQISGGGSLTAPKTYIVGACEGGPLNPPSLLDEGSVILGDPLADLPPPSFGPPGAFCGDPLDPTVNQTTAAGAEGCTFNGNGVTYPLFPGVYYGGWRIGGNGVTLHLEPGIYIMAGGGIKLSASGTITSVELSTGVPAAVMIFSTDDPMYAAACKASSGTGNQCQDHLDFTAGSDLLLHGLTAGPYKGILMWQDGNGSGLTAGPKLDTNLSGQTSLNLSGTIYNPRGVVTVTGGSRATSVDYAAIQIISWRWKVAGGGTVNMPYDPSLLYQFMYKGLVR